MAYVGSVEEIAALDTSDVAQCCLSGLGDCRPAAYDEKQKRKEEKHAAYLEKVAGDFANLRQAHAEEREKYLAY